MKILFISDNFYPETNAAASRVFERAVYWVKKGHDVTIVTSCPNFPEGKPFTGYKNKWRNIENLQGLRVVRVKTFMAANQGVVRRMLDFISFMFSSFFFSLFEEKPDVVVASSPQFFAAISGYLVALVKRVPFGLEIADLWPESIRAVGAIRKSLFLDVMERVELYLYHHADFIITLTSSIGQNMISRGVDSDKISTIINGVNLDFFKKSQVKDKELVDIHKLDGKFVVGYIGTFGMAHNLQNLLEAAKLLLMEKNTEIHFIIVGAGAERKDLLEFRHENSLHNVSIIERQPKSEIQRYWSILDLSLVHLKNSDTFRTVIPSKIFEAMAVGKPILYCGPESDGSMIVTKEGVGEQINSGNPTALKEKIIELSQDSERIKLYAGKTEAAVGRYTREQQANQFIKVIDKNLSYQMAMSPSVSESAQ